MPCPAFVSPADDAAAPAAQRLEICPHCDSVVAMHALRAGEVAACPRCGHALERFQGWSASQLLALCLTAWVAIVHALLFPLVTLDVQGHVQGASIWESIVFAWSSGHWVVGWMTLAGAVLLPVAELAVLTATLGLIALRYRSSTLVPMLRMVAMTRHWNMLAVFLLGVLVALIKLSSIGRLQLNVGLVSTACLVALMAVLARVSAHTLWRMAEAAHLVPAAHVPAQCVQHGMVRTPLLVCHCCGMPHAAPMLPPQAPPAPAPHLECVRCHSRLRLRWDSRLAHCWAYLLTALVFYVPANTLPIMQTSSMTDAPTDHTIISGVLDLYQSGSWLIAAVVFTASLAVPVLKFAVMLWLLLSVQRRWVGNETHNAWLLRLMELVGQWSMLDVFVVVLLAALLQFEGLVQVTIGAAALSFGVMVVCSMLAAQSLDPRLLWNARDALL